ncbi:murein biosynthesis integral membrane protein MurJ [Mycolicibacterium conceptionense]|uniref:murein biosynthesis integral membrane protein MurJ n=1 Tax=Mycolicibacterium conceptionense TaxID=451644 RepID=UPI0007ED92DD|nr:murein biosynthesis integral membrane protein MurJ [Mycolicibacterium conceptionense]OBK03303.1 murein biosynthesis integral membrane protein MurJ [Mycolicibacterium conceptionense]OMB86777.1 murein biosynthesis integral membrane protein MurJ [Mycolicibacterium conceptionense]OMB89466.1 murein biosynthesis integral membrane protein MurJ [Mycolicibacterium conceptionense]
MTASGHNPSRPQRAPAPPAGRAELSDAAVVSRSWGMAFATLISRITGFLRFVLLMALLGGPLTSSFSVANQLPNMVAALVLEATFTAIFVPVLVRAERDDPDGGRAFIRRLVTLATTLLLVTTVVSVVCAPLLVKLMLGSHPEVDTALTTSFAYLLLPQVLFYGLTSVYGAILNTRNIFGPPAWAPVVNNVIAILTLGIFVLVPGALSENPVQMGTAKLLVLGIGTTLGVVAQAVVLLVAIRTERVSLRPMWGIDDRLKKFGGMAAAMVLYVLINQVGFIVGNRIASSAAASGPAIYNYTWLVLMLPFGMIGVTVLTVVMPRLSRNAAANDIPAVLDDFSLATRLTMVTLIPIVAMMTVGGPAIGSALFAYGRFSVSDAGYLGMAITLSSFTLIPYALVLLQLRVLYARERPWTPIVIVVVISVVKIIGSVAAPHVTDDPSMVAGYLGLANGLGYVAGAIAGYVLLKGNLRPRGGQLLRPAVIRTILVTVAASLVASLVAHTVDQLLGLESLTAWGGPGGSLLRLIALGLIMVPIIAGVMLAADVPEAHSALDMVRRRLGRGRVAPAPGAGQVAAQTIAPPVAAHPAAPVTYPDQRNSSPSGWPSSPAAAGGGTPAGVAGAGMWKGSPVTDESADGPAANSASSSGMTTETTKLPRPAADEFQPDVAPAGPESTTGPDTGDASDDAAGGHTNGATRPLTDFGGDPTREPISFAAPNDAGLDSADDDVHLIPGATIADGRYRLLVFHGGPPHLQFWQALDTALDRQVALTFVDPDSTMPDAKVQEILSRTLKLSRIDVPGIARVLDVAHSGSGGLIVSEWIRGGSLAEVADTSPSPIGGARAIQSLAAAAEAAHRAGVALSIDHPARVRVSIEGDVALAFPATMPDATPDDDIRGIGAALYALLVNRWPLPESGARSGLEPAALDQAGQPVEPRAIDRDIPFQISAAAARAVQPGGGIRSAPTLLNLLQQATAIADRTELLGSVEETPAPAAPVRAHETPEEHEAAEARRRKGLIIGISVGAAIILIALLVMASVLNSIFGDVGGGLNRDELGLNAPSASTEETQDDSAAASGSTVKPVRATVFSPEGEADSPATAGQAIDGNSSTAWSTDTYSDPAPFPGFKNGVGLMLQLPQPTVVGSVTLNVTSTGTSVQIRSAQSANPSSLSDTTELTPSTALKPGSNTISVKKESSTSYVLVWISTLGTVDGKSRTDISEITIKAAS